MNFPPDGLLVKIGKQLTEINSDLSVQQVCEESGELLRQALEEKEDENRKRYELIQQIRAIESTPSIRHKFVDLTEVSSKGKTTVFTVVNILYMFHTFRAVVYCRYITVWMDEVQGGPVHVVFCYIA